ncbi:40S ribosomal protein S15 [Candida tropicalis MYA-3404]|uniref:40S ribosomal protein S15 n=1 Tax=Candida tropicalis (strain ATCC MYA-3404 / T1) TaxID=294747 RepID=C5M7W2_CANTT|nr:40S ribosomal protein S15 [Candida tropicalis MYA-3404]EER33666.1 40S ribosomal protein S15 [Candida tropicalis MYA-3404]KAG4407510.1 hypothetical protein JTP64_003045 [Candida tropicalis]
MKGEKYCTYIYYNNNSIHLSQWHEFRRSVTSSTVSNWSISNGEFTQVVTNHFWFDFNSVENFTIVNTDNRTNHFWNNDHVSQVSFDSSWSFIWLSVSSGNSQFFNQTHWFGVQTSGESSSDSSTTQFGEFFSWHFNQIF